MNTRANLQVHTGVQVQRIVFEGRRAVGIQYVQNGVQHEVRARKEVLLCAGAFNSPQLLMVSGVGPAAHLQSHGIAVVHDLPGVGQNLQDHPDFTLGYEVDSLLSKYRCLSINC